MKRVRLDVAYKGTDFHGFARQRNDEVETVAGRLEVALLRYLGTETKVTCAGRTDAGVHALGQVVSFDVAEDVSLENMLASVSKQIGTSIAVSNPVVVDSNFSARFSAQARHYRYLVDEAPVRNPLMNDTVWWVGRELDLKAMNQAAESLIGEHDFSSFCRRPENGASLIRRITSAGWHRHDDLLQFRISANAFCHQMVRSITGELVSVGLGKRTAEAVAKTLEAKNRQAAAAIAPPQGLCLMKVDF